MGRSELGTLTTPQGDLQKPLWHGTARHGTARARIGCSSGR
jgi:hypothetical protein